MSTTNTTTPAKPLTAFIVENFVGRDALELEALPPHREVPALVGLGAYRDGFNFHVAIKPDTARAMAAALLKQVTPLTIMKGKNDIKIYASGARASAGAIATVRIPCGRDDAAWDHARLLAAAPDLLVALRRLVEDAAGPHDPDEWTPSRPYQMAVAAILKATGTGGRVPA